MVVFKRKQIVVLALILMIIVAGYLQYTYRKSSVSVNGKENGKLGEAVYVENNELSPQDQKASNDGKAVKAANSSKQANDFFAQAKLDKEVTRSKDTTTLKSITEDANASKEAKEKAYSQMIAITANAEKEMRVESLIREKGFSDVVAMFGDDGSVDVVVKTPSLTSAQAAQISDIVSRQANVDISKIHIKNMF